ncbi:MAG TPA: glycosyltransferase family 9 protein [Gaiellaceae bacterium]
MKPHVLVVRLDSDGDVLVTGPAIRAVAAGASRVTLLCGPRGRQAAALLPGVDGLVVHRAAWIDPEPDAIDRRVAAALVDELAAVGADEAVVFTSFHQSALPTALLLRMAGVRRIGAISDDYPGSLLDVRHRVDDDVHEVERALSLAAAFGFELPHTDDARLAVRRAPLDFPLEPGYVVVHPGASVPARAWPHHATLVAALATAGRRVVVTGSADERGLTAAVAGSHPDVLDLGGKTTLGELADILAGAAAVVVGNTGPAHLAAAVGTPVVSLFAPVVPAARWRPWRVPHLLLGDQHAACAGTRARECPVPGHPCLSSVSPDDVLAAVAQLGSLEEREAVAL